MSGCYDGGKVIRTGRDIEIDECKLLLLVWISTIIRGVSEERKTHQPKQTEFVEQESEVRIGGTEELKIAAE